MPFLDPPASLRTSLWIAASFALVVVVGVIDYLTGYELAFSLFYLLPIFLSAWFVGRNAGLAVSVASAAVWLIADVTAGNGYSHPIIYFWNTAIRLSTFAIMALLLARVRSLLEHERELARTDYLTGAMNLRQFIDLVQMEAARSQRSGQPFTLAYMDLDDFKKVNDECGHLVGNNVLKVVVDVIRTGVRQVDIVARLGGDEFCLLLPETGPDAAQVVISRIRTALMDEMQRNHWPVTFSIGVISYISPDQSADMMIRQADNLMYRAKAEGKNNTFYSAV